MAVIYDTTYVGTPAITADSTAAFQTAVTAAAGKTLIVTQKIGISPTGINVPSNATIKFLPGAGLRMIAHNADTYDMLRLTSVSNVTIKYANIDGAKESNAATTGEWGMGIGIYGNCSNIKIVDPVIQDTWGDGIYFGEAAAGTACTGVVIDNAQIYGVRRNGFSVITAAGLIINNATVGGVGETDPKAAIDFEPNNNGNKLEGIYVNNLTSVNCNEGIICYLGSWWTGGTTARKLDIHINGHTDVGSLDRPLDLIYCQPTAVQVVAGSAFNLAKSRYIGAAQDPILESTWNTARIPVNGFADYVAMNA